jgi:hypothetical protein
MLKRPQLNPGIKSVVLKLGDEKVPIIVIDKFVGDSMEIVEHVSNFKNMGQEKSTYYPGLREVIDATYSQFVLDALSHHLYVPFNIPSHFKPRMDAAYYSLVTTPPDSLLPEQSRPHTDSAMPYYLAVLHYLSPGGHGGTGFFKHKQTGYEKITSERIDGYLKLVAGSEKPTPGYVRESTSQYELIGEVGYRENRVIIYPGCLLHSGLINPLTDLDSNPKIGRLTANFFLNFS